MISIFFSKLLPAVEFEFRFFSNTGFSQERDALAQENRQLRTRLGMRSTDLGVGFRGKAAEGGANGGDNDGDGEGGASSTMDPRRLVGRRVRVEDLGIGEVISFHKVAMGLLCDSPHRITLDNGGTTEVLLQRRKMGCMNRGRPFAVLE